VPPPAELTALQGFLAGALRREAPIAADAALAQATRAHVAGNDRLSPVEQADIYREQFWLRHVDCLNEDYPGLRALVGATVFEALVHGYLDAYPPRTPSLRDLGADLPAFAEGFRGFPAEQRAGALDMLRYEHRFIDLFDGKDPPPLDARKLQSLDEAAWERARIVLHPLLARVQLDYPMHLYRLAAMDAEEAPPFPDRRPVCLALYRREGSIQYDEIEPEAFALLDALGAGEPLTVACDRLAQSLDAAAAEALPMGAPPPGPTRAEALAAQVGPWFQDWTAKGWIVDVVV
jgi:hypothetical protein